MKKIFFLLMAFVALTMTSCDKYQAMRDIKSYEETSRNEKVHSIRVKQFENTNIYVAKVRYCYKDWATVPVFHVYKWDRYGYLDKLDTSIENFEIVQSCFHECLETDDYVLCAAICIWEENWKNGNKSKEICDYITEIRETGSYRLK